MRDTPRLMSARMQTPRRSRPHAAPAPFTARSTGYPMPRRSSTRSGRGSRSLQPRPTHELGVSVAASQQPWPPEADQTSDEGDQEDLAHQHLEPGEHPSGLAGWDEVPVAGGGQGGEAEEEDVSMLEVDAGPEERSRLHPVEGRVEEREEQAEDRVDADRPEDGAEADLGFLQHRAQNRARGDQQEDDHVE